LVYVVTRIGVRSARRDAIVYALRVGWSCNRALSNDTTEAWGICMRLILLGAAAAASACLAFFTTTPAGAREVVAFPGDASPGQLIVPPGDRRLDCVVGDGRAIRYPVGVGKAGKQWSGRTYIDGKHLRPAWSPPAAVKRDKPSLPDVIPGGSPRNPMGEAA